MKTKKETSTKTRKKLPVGSFDSEFAFSWGKMGAFFGIIWESAKKYPILFWSMNFVVVANAVMATLLPLASAKMSELLLAANPDGTPIDDATNQLVGITMHWDSWIYVCIIIFVAMLVLEYLTDYTIGVFSARVEIGQREKILISLVNQDVDFFFDHVSGNILTRFVGDTQALAMGIQQFVTNILYLLGSFVAAVVILFVEQQNIIGAIGLGYVLGVLIIAFIIFVYYRRSMIRAYDIKRLVDADMTDRINNITLIKSTGTELYEIGRLQKQNEQYNRKGDVMVFFSATLNFWLQVTINFLTTLILIIAVVGSINGFMPKDVATSLVLGLPMISWMALSVIMLVPTLRAASRSANASDRINELTGPKPTILPNVDGPKIEKIEKITFKNLDFAYPKKAKKIIIPKMNLTFEKGKSYAFVGETGSGKSTIGRLLLRYYEPVKGQIIINDQYNLNEVNLPSYLDRIGYVEQDPQIFYGNFIDNIRYARFNATKEEVIEAAKKAKLHDFILTLPEGYETVLGQRGFLLSGGQKQRLIIARVFLKNPDLIILDEATSALDNIVEKEIQAQLDELVVGKTSITIAHRLSTIKNVDQVIVLGMGKGIVQTGTFEDLIHQEGHFKNLYEAGKMK